MSSNERSDPYPLGSLKFEALEYQHRDFFCTSGLHLKIERPDRHSDFELTELPPPRAFSRSSVEALAAVLSAIRLPVLPPVAFGIDGSCSTLTIRAVGNNAVYEWYCSPGEEWSDLLEMEQQILRITGCQIRHISAEEKRRRQDERAAESKEYMARAAIEEPKRRQALERRKNAVRRKAILFRMAWPSRVDQVLYDMPVERFLRHFGSYGVSRVDFKPRS